MSDQIEVDDSSRITDPTHSLAISTVAHPAVSSVNLIYSRAAAERWK